ncbi:MAG: N-acetylglucosamine-6-phosphate deacetylase [Clostridiales bacterium]|jgi:N-acetylglucosamine-6-phosphate deacetylase|nr:N-acetylglucosamine-6-phosphate deacetylase [Clostridiales bacterium]
MGYIIKSKKMCMENGVIENTPLFVEGGLIKHIGPEAENMTGEAIDLKDYTLLPGFIDIHVHGGGGYDIMDATYEAVDAISKFKIKEGVTSFCPTTVTASLDSLKAALNSITEAMDKGVSGADILGPFIEGPYINAHYKGAHPEDKIRPVNLDEIKDLVSHAKGNVSIAIAPELKDALKAIKYIADKGITVRIGHTGADYDCVNSAVRNGAKIAVHTYNAMSPLTHRDPGTVGGVMDNDELYAELIFDTVHVHPAAARILARVKPEGKMVLITDCMRAGGLTDGEYMLGELPVIVKDSIARTETGNLAGSTVSLNKAVNNMLKLGKFDMIKAVNMASLNPANALGLTDRGLIALGKRADLIAVDGDFNVKFVMVNGKILINNIE